MAFKVPAVYHDVPFLKDYKYVKRNRLFSKASLTAANINHMALDGIKFFIHGQCFTTLRIVQMTLYGEFLLSCLLYAEAMI